MKITAIRDKENHQILTDIQFHKNEEDQMLPVTIFAELVGINKVICNKLAIFSQITGDNIEPGVFAERLCEELHIWSGINKESSK